MPPRLLNPAIHFQQELSIYARISVNERHSVDGLWWQPFESPSKSLSFSRGAQRGPFPTFGAHASHHIGRTIGAVVRDYDYAKKVRWIIQSSYTLQRWAYAVLLVMRGNKHYESRSGKFLY